MSNTEYLRPYILRLDDGEKAVLYRAVMRSIVILGIDRVPQADELTTLRTLLDQIEELR